VRIVLATSALIRGGVWRHIEDLAVALSAGGEEVVLGLRPEARALRERARALGIPWRELAATASWRRCLWHVHLHDTFDRRLAAAVIARRAVGPTVITEHLPRTNASDESLLAGRRHPLARPAKTLLKRADYAGADAVISVSPSSARFIAERYRTRRKIDVVFNGIVASPTVTTVAPGSETMHVVSIGSVIHQKGHDLLLEAAEHSRGGWRATVVGDGRLREALARQADSHALPISFNGWRDDLSSVLASADVVCLPSRWESCPYACLEAMDAGKPVVGTDVDGLRDLVQNELTGVLVRPEDAIALASALDRLAREDAARAAMGQAARVRAGRFTLERMVQETSAIYDRVMAARPGRG
jgi:glycosyltransferase involved in cell wall biosynthesis